MALLTAVVSVTSITFTDKNELQTEHHCHLPNRFSIKSSYDLPSCSTLFPKFFSPTIDYQNPVILPFRFLVLSSLRNSLIEQSIMNNNRNLYVFSDNLIQIIEHSLKVHKIDYDLSTIPLDALCFLISQSNNIEYLPILINNHTLKDKITFKISSPKILFDIEAIKSTLVNKSKPLAISIPFDLISFQNNEKTDISYLKKFDSSFLSNRTLVYLIYGWNDDFMIKTIPNHTLTGGFIVRQFIKDVEGHSISYYHGNLTKYEEASFCPQLTQLSFLHNKIKLICINKNKCNKSSNYYIESYSDPQGYFQEIQNGTSIKIEFLEISENNHEKKVSLNFKNLYEFSLSFSIEDRSLNDHCNFFFLPFDVLLRVFARSKTVEQLAYGISLSIDWDFPTDIDLSRYFTVFSDRPAPLFEI